MFQCRISYRILHFIRVASLPHSIDSHETNIFIVVILAPANPLSTHRAVVPRDRGVGLLQVISQRRRCSVIFFNVSPVLYKVIWCLAAKILTLLGASQRGVNPRKCLLQYSLLPHSRRTNYQSENLFILLISPGFLLA